MRRKVIGTLIVLALSILLVFWQSLPRHWSFYYKGMTIQGFSRGFAVEAHTATFRLNPLTPQKELIMIHIGDTTVSAVNLTENLLMRELPHLESETNPDGVRFISGYSRGGLVTFYYCESRRCNILSLTSSDSLPAQSDALPAITFSYNGGDAIQLPVSRFSLYQRAGIPQEVSSAIAIDL